MIGIDVRVARQIAFLRPEDQRKLLQFIKKNPDIWQELVRQRQESRFIENFVKSRNSHIKEFTKISDTLSGTMRKLYRQIKNIDLKLESPIEYAMLRILDEMELFFEVQKEIGKYRVDFLIIPNIIIECDGAEWHRANLEQILNDSKKDKFLVSRGYIVLRYSRHAILHRVPEIKKELESVILGEKNVI